MFYLGLITFCALVACAASVLAILLDNAGVPPVLNAFLMVLLGLTTSIFVVAVFLT